jgi:hypothetical protein
MKVRAMRDRASSKFALAASAAAFGGFTIFGAGAAHAASGDRIGDAVAITNVVMANYEQNQRKLVVGGDVRQDDAIEVNPDAEGQLKLEDDTKLALGPGSRLVLDTFVYDSNKKSGSIILNLAKGAFRFITGVAAKPTYVINTPNASITVRGTIFDVYILTDNSVWLLLQEGALEATGTKNVCQVLDQPGQLIHVANDGTVSPPVNWSNMPGNAAVPFDTAFPFVTNVPQIDTRQPLSRDDIVSAAFPTPAAKPCVNPHTPIELHTPQGPTRKADGRLPTEVVPVAVPTREVVAVPAREVVVVAPPPLRWHPRPPRWRHPPKDWGKGKDGGRDKYGNRGKRDNYGSREKYGRKKYGRDQGDHRAAKAAIGIGLGVMIGGGFGGHHGGGGGYGGGHGGR